MNTLFQVIEKDVYGNTLVYPFNDVAKRFAILLKVKSFNSSHLIQIREIGYNVVNLTQEAAASAIVGKW